LRRVSVKYEFAAFRAIARIDLFLCSSMPETILLTGACGVTSRAVARCIRRSPRYRDCRIVGTDICENLFGLYEGLSERVYRVPASRDPGYADAIIQICERERVDAAIVIPELEVLFWSQNQMPVPALLPPPKFANMVVSKARMTEALAETGLVPRSEIVSAARIEAGDLGTFKSYPVWVRDFVEGVTSGKGALCVRNSDEARAWMLLNRGIENFMVSEFLPGRNFACILIYDQGKLVKSGIYERLEYFMARTVMSGISGNISRGRLANEPAVREASERAVMTIAEKTGETIHGLFAVDLREAADGSPKLTEINLRYVAAFSAFANAVFNLVETQLDLALGRRGDLGPVEIDYPESNLILRDIDGIPLWQPTHRPLEVGEYLDPVPGR
jgi:hypothetical protein